MHFRDMSRDEVDAEIAGRWRRGDTAQQIATALGYASPVVVVHRLATLRRAGVALEKRRSGPRGRIDVDALNRLLGKPSDGAPESSEETP